MEIVTLIGLRYQQVVTQGALVVYPMMWMGIALPMPSKVFKESLAPVDLRVLKALEDPKAPLDPEDLKALPDKAYLAPKVHAEIAYPSLMIPMKMDGMTGLKWR